MISRERLLEEEQARRFPLVLWQQTPEYQAEYEAALRHFKQIRVRLYEGGFRCGVLSDLRFDKDGYPEVWLNDSRPYLPRILKTEGALKLARKYGRIGWWQLGELAELAEGQGPIIEKAMRSMGFRSHRRIPGRWARLRPDEPREAVRHEEDIFVPVGGEELQRLQALMVLPNTTHGAGKTFYIEVGKRGLIFIHLWVNPFAGARAETLGEFGVQLPQRGHLASEQQGFTITAANVSLSGEKAIHITATAPGRDQVETVWSNSTSRAGLFQLANDLDQRLRASACA